MPIYILVAFFLFLWAAPTKCESTFFVSPLVVTATKYPQEMRKTGVNIQVITGKQLADLGCSTIKEALNLIPAIHLTDSAGQISIYSRGMAANHSKVMIDGVSLIDAVSPQGTPYLDTLSLMDVERLEIITGASGVIQGASAEGGAINIITKRDGGEWQSQYSPQKSSTSAFYTFHTPDITAGLSLGLADNRLKKHQ